MHTYYVFRDADIKKPGSGSVEEIFTAENDGSAKQMADRHFENTGMTLWLREGKDPYKFSFIHQMGKVKNGASKAAR